MKTILQCTVFSILFGWFAGLANTLKVPEDYSSIQEAINAAVNGDTVLVNSGTYQENINFRGKNIVVTSYYGITSDVGFINTTIIDGSNPVYPDTASCVLIISGEDSSAVLQGFTLTGGKGTKWADEHGAGTFVEGGGIFMTFSSPTIKYNLIVNNEAINSPSGTVSAGGGAIRCGDGSPHIINNVILNNKGMYGGGIVLNYCSGALIANNIINANRVYQAVEGRQTFGGGGLWIYESIPNDETPNKIINNTITGNSSNSIGSGIRLWATFSIVKNNIVWYNFQNDNTQINISGFPGTLEYNNVENTMDGTGNISLLPSFADSSFYLNTDSPCIDAGDPGVQYNDIENSNSSGNALFPSLGTVRNDMGAYGGSMPLLFSEFTTPNLYFPSNTHDFGLTLPGESIMMSITILNNGSDILRIDSTASVQNTSTISTQDNFPIVINPFESGEITLTWTPQTNLNLFDTLLIYDNDKYSNNITKIIITGSSFPNALLFFNTSNCDFGDIDINIGNVDTTLYVVNNGTAPDSVYISVNYERVRPDSAFKISPNAFLVGPKDSVGVTVTIYPSLVTQSILNQFQPKLIVDSRFSVGDTRFIKTVKFHLVGASEVNDGTKFPDKFRLSQNYPNPFNPTTKIKYQIANREFVSLKIYNILGKEEMTLVNEEKQSGSYEVELDARDLSSGIYFYSINAGTFKESRKMILLK